MNGRNIRRRVNSTSHQFRMTPFEIHNTIEAKQKLHDALNILDAISAYSIHHRLPGEQLFDIDVRKRLQSLYPKLPSPIYPLLEELDELTQDQKNTLSPYCYKIEDSADDFDDVLDGLEAHHKQMSTRNLSGKGELIDTIIRSGVSKTIKSVTVILDVIGSLAIWHIREVEARTLAARRGHQVANPEDKSNAATEMWQYLSSYNDSADRKQLDARITAGIRWNRFLGGREVGMIVTVHKLPPSLKFQTKLIDKLALVVADMPGMLDRAKKATPYMQKLLDSRLGPWTGSKKRQLPVQSVSELSPEHRGSDTETESGTPGSNSIGALLNAAELIATARQDEALDQHRKRRRFDSLSLSSEDRESIVTAGSPEDVNLQARIVPANSSISQPPDEQISDQGGGITEDINPRDTDCNEPQTQGEMLDQRRRVGSFPPSDKIRGFIVIPEALVGVSLLAGIAPMLNSSFSQQPKIARMAEVDKLEIPLGGYFFERIKASRLRRQEEERQCMRFTDTVRLHVAYRPGEDIKLEMWLCASIVNDISQAAIDSAGNLRNVVGDYLFEAMKASNWWKEDERKGTVDFNGAVILSFPDRRNGSDCKVELLLGSKIGLDLYKTVFP